MSDNETGNSIDQRLRNEMERIKALFEPTDSDGEDLITYAKEIVRMRDLKAHTDAVELRA